MPQPAYQIGDKVCLVGQPDRVGVVSDRLREVRGAFYYPVFFSASDCDGQYAEQALLPARHVWNPASGQVNERLSCGVEVRAWDIPLTFLD